jgi:hypothetical protein
MIKIFVCLIVQDYQNAYQKSPAQLLTHTSPTWSHVLQLIMHHNANFLEKHLPSFTSSSIN